MSSEESGGRTLRRLMLKYLETWLLLSVFGVIVSAVMAAVSVVTPDASIPGMVEITMIFAVISLCLLAAHSVLKLVLTPNAQ